MLMSAAPLKTRSKFVCDRTRMHTVRVLFDCIPTVRFGASLRYRETCCALRCGVLKLGNAAVINRKSYGPVRRGSNYTTLVRRTRTGDVLDNIASACDVQCRLYTSS